MVRHDDAGIDYSCKIYGVTCYDLDAGDNGHVTYRVVNKDRPEVEKFRLDSESGAVVVAELLDTIDHMTFQLNILAVDHGVPARCDIAMITFL